MDPLPRRPSRRLRQPTAQPSNVGEALPDVPTLDRVEWEHIQRVLTGTGGNISRTAQLLGIDRRSLQRKLGKYPPSR